MQIVGEHLAKTARQQKTGDEFDLFARSAFNRFYYAAFLSVRRVLATIEPDWAEPSHQAVPEVLKGQVLKRLKGQINTFNKAGIIGYPEGQTLYSAAAAAAVELSNLLSSARETRRIADYEPDIKVDTTGSSVKLGQFSLDQAKKWQSRVETQAKTILKVYGILSLI